MVKIKSSDNTKGQQGYSESRSLITWLEKFKILE